MQQKSATKTCGECDNAHVHTRDVWVSLLCQMSRSPCQVSFDTCVHGVSRSGAEGVEQTCVRARARVRQRTRVRAFARVCVEQPTRANARQQNGCRIATHAGQGPCPRTRACRLIRCSPAEGWRPAPKSLRARAETRAPITQACARSHARGRVAFRPITPRGTRARPCSPSHAQRMPRRAARCHAAAEHTGRVSQRRCTRLRRCVCIRLCACCCASRIRAAPRGLRPPRRPLLLLLLAHGLHPIPTGPPVRRLFTPHKRH